MTQTHHLEIGEHIRQGDVLLIRRASTPAGAAKQNREKGGVVLAHGEVTGHMHQLRGPQVAKFRDDGGHEYLVVKDRPEPLIHDEHTAIPISVGDFELGAQVEYEPAALRVVAD